MRALVPALLLPAFLAIPPAGAEATPTAKDAALLQALKAQRLTRVEFKDVSLEGAIKWLRVATGRNFFVKRTALAKANIDWESLRYEISLEDVTVGALLEILLEPHDMAYVVKDNVVFLTSKIDSYGKPVTRLYGISHITWTKVDFIAPAIDLTPSGFVPDEYEPEVVVEDDPLNSGEAVAELIKELVLPEAWTANDEWNIRATDRHLVVRAPKAVHDLIPSALDKIASMK
jgi:hypothetical protein